MSSRDRRSIVRQSRELSTLFEEWDPVGIYGSGSDVSAGEYWDLVHPTMGLLTRGASADAIAVVISDAAETSYGVTLPADTVRAFADRLVTWFGTES